MAAYEDAVDAAAADLTVRVGSQTYTVAPTEVPVIIGRDDPNAAQPARVRIPDGRISRTHLILDLRGGQWVGIPQGRNGVFVDGHEMHAEFRIPDEGLVAVLGHPLGGIAVHFSTLDPAIVYVGARVAKRRTELDLSQRTLAANRIINAGALISFEKGRSWPREKTREKLEDALGWPPGTIARLRRDHVTDSTNVTAVPDEERTELITSTGGTTTIDAHYLAETVEVALANIRAQLGGLPDPSAADFPPRVTAILADLRRLEELASHAARGTRGAEQIYKQLGAVRRTYREVMLLAATSPHATLGQRLFAARHRGELSVEEAAAMGAVTPDDVRAAEAGAPLTEPKLAALHHLLTALQ